MSSIVINLCLQIYYSGTDAQKEQVRAAVEKSQAQFHYISAQ